MLTAASTRYRKGNAARDERARREHALWMTNLTMLMKRDMSVALLMARINTRVRMKTI